MYEWCVKEKVLCEWVNLTCTTGRNAHKRHQDLWTTVFISSLIICIFFAWRHVEIQIYQSDFNCIAHLHKSPIVSQGLTMCDTLCPEPCTRARRNYQKKHHINRGKKRRNLREPHVRDPSPRTDRSAVDATCNGEHQQNNSFYNND